MDIYKKVNRLKINFYSVFVILVLICLSTVLGNSAPATHDQIPTGTSTTAATVAKPPSMSERTTVVNSTYSGMLFNTYVDMRRFRYIFARLVTIYWF